MQSLHHLSPNRSNNPLNLSQTPILTSHQELVSIHPLLILVSLIVLLNLISPLLHHYLLVVINGLMTIIDEALQRYLNPRRLHRLRIRTLVRIVFALLLIQYLIQSLIFLVVPHLKQHRLLLKILIVVNTMMIILIIRHHQRLRY